MMHLRLLRVLLATNSATLRDLLEGHSDAGQVVAVVAHAGDATEVQSLALAYTPDAIILDATLPGALPAAQSLLHLTLQESRLLVIANENDPARLLDWLQVGARDILLPPLNSDQLLAALIRACDHDRSASHACERPVSPRILLVSKSADAGVRLATFLRQHLDLHDVDQAGSSADAIRQAAAQHHTIALIDADQFGRSAFDIAVQVRSYAPMTSVVLLVAQIDTDKVRLAAQNGVRDILLKPPTLDSLKTTFDRAQVFAQALRWATTGTVTAPELPHSDAVSAPDATAAAPVATAQAPAVIISSRGRIFTIYSPGGGNGSTTLACGLALLLRRRDLRVALLDADLQFGNAAALLGVPVSVTLDQIAERVTRLRWPEEELAHHPSGLHLLPAPTSIVQGALINADLLIRVVQRLRDYYDLLVIDAPHALNDHSVRLLKLADHVLVPVRTWATQQGRITALRELLECSGFHADRLHLIQSGFGQERHGEAAAVINLDVLAAQLAAGDAPDLTPLEALTDRLLATC
jgi:pilus assembly protein CpaE